MLGDQELAAALADERLARIRDSVRHQSRPGSMIDYRTRWFDDRAIERESVDMLLSQAVLEHVDDLAGSYRAMRLWIKPGGLMSHQIDFRCHNTARVWNGHWRYSDFVWRLIRGRRSYLLNREPYSTHLRLLEENGFHVVGGATTRSDSQIVRAQIAPRFRDMTDQDLIISSALIQAVPAPASGREDELRQANRRHSICSAVASGSVLKRTVIRNMSESYRLAVSKVERASRPLRQRCDLSTDRQCIRVDRGLLLRGSHVHRPVRCDRAARQRRLHMTKVVPRAAASRYWATVRGGGWPCQSGAT